MTRVLPPRVQEIVAWLVENADRIAAQPIGAVQVDYSSNAITFTLKEVERRSIDGKLLCVPSARDGSTN